MDDMVIAHSSWMLSLEQAKRQADTQCPTTYYVKYETVDSGPQRSGPFFDFARADEHAGMLSRLSSVMYAVVLRPSAFLNSSVQGS